ncbi:MAG: extracellular solute-binding protein [Candidatus Paceibacterota bacterium]
MSNFQTILIAIFLSFFVFGVLIFSGLIKIPGSTVDNGLQGKVVIWGTFPSSSMSKILDNIRSANRDLSLSYVSKDPATYQQNLIEAFANGVGPDLFIITSDQIQKDINFLYKIPYTDYKQKTFIDSFVDGADIYTDSEGVLGFPLVVDPMVLYYNKDILSNEAIVSPPASWDELFTLNSTLTKKENNGTITQSMIALGQYENLNNAKDILATLLIQNNNPIVKKGTDLVYLSVLNSNPLGLTVSPVATVFKFFMEFSNPSNTAYSWNRSLPSSLDMFTGGKLAFYIGRASELFNIESLNPNLSFDVTQIPQIKNTTIKRTYGEIYAIAINKKSANISTALNIASNLSLGDNAKNFATSVSLPPASRALLADKPNDPYLFTFFNSALISRSWPDPDKIKTDTIFSELVENILSNRLSVYEAVNKAQSQLEVLIKK